MISITFDEAREIVAPQVRDLLAQLRRVPPDDRPTLEDVVTVWAAAVVTELVRHLDRRRRETHGDD